METLIETVVMLLLLTDLALFGLGLLSTCIRVAAIQGVLMGLFALIVQPGELTVRLIVIVALTAALKGFVFPLLLKRAVKEVGMTRESSPFLGYGMSVMAGVLLFSAALWLGAGAGLTPVSLHPLAVPVSFMTLFTGLFLILSRRTALMQCLGYIVCENGIYMFGMAAVGEIPALVELGMLLDAFVAVFVMGIMIYQINRAFDHIDTDRMSSLKG